MFLGIDLGTGSVKVMLLDRTGGEHTASRPYSVDAPQTGYAESDPDSWLSALAEALADLDAHAHACGDPGLASVSAVGLSGQMHGVVVVRRGDGAEPTPLMPAVLWADRRSTAELERYRDLSAEDRTRLGNLPAAGMAGPSLLWITRHHPQVIARAEAVLFPKDYVRAVLTGEWFTDRSDASGSLLYDFARRDWARDIAASLGVPHHLLPTIRESTTCGGTVTQRASDRFGIPAGVPVAIGAGDTPAAMFGTHLTERNTVQISVGTAAQAARPIDPSTRITPSPVNVFEGATPALRYHVAAMLNGGLALEWVRKRLNFSWDDLYTELEDRPWTDPGDLVFLPYLTGERTPYMNPHARGAWLGLSLHHDNTDLAFAALLGVACTVRLGVETLQQGSEEIDAVRLVGGSARYAAWRRMLAMMLSRDMDYSVQTDSSARGAAYLAAATVGEKAPAAPPLRREFSRSAAWADTYYTRFLEQYRMLHPAST